MITIGSHGDVHPFVGLGITLRRRGHRVTLATNEHFRRLVEQAELEFAQLGTDEQFREILRNADLWHPRKAFKIVFELSAPLIEMAYQIIAERNIPGETVVVGSSLALGARIAHEKLGVPLATLHLAPAVMRSIHDVPKLPGLLMPAWLPLGFKRALWNFADRFVIDPFVGPPVNQQRAKLGLSPPARGILRDWWHSPQLILGMWPGWFGPVQPDWPAQLRLTGFPLYDESGLTHLPPDLDEWLNAGEAPIAFTAGSAMVHAEEFFRASADACVRLNRRGLLLTRHPAGQIPQRLPPTVRHVDYAPFTQLLPRCAALVHHGGIGTTAQALQAGIPQLITPLAHDQFDNAMRVKRLGMGQSISPRAYGATRAAHMLGELLGRSDIRRRGEQLSDDIRASDGLGSAADLVESLLRAPSSAHSNT